MPPTRAGGDGIQGRTAGSADGPGVKRQAGDDSRDDNANKRPVSSHSIPKIRSLVEANTYCKLPCPTPTPNRPPEAA